MPFDAGAATAAGAVALASVFVKHFEHVSDVSSLIAKHVDQVCPSCSCADFQFNRQELIQLCIFCYLLGLLTGPFLDLPGWSGAVGRLLSLAQQLVDLLLVTRIFAPFIPDPVCYPQLHELACVLVSTFHLLSPSQS